MKNVNEMKNEGVSELVKFRHSRAGGNPANLTFPHGGTKPRSCLPCRFVVSLDSRLRGNDGYLK
jgi:hypothetical protein